MSDTRRIQCHMCKTFGDAMLLVAPDGDAAYLFDCPKCGAGQSFPAEQTPDGRYRIEPAAYRRYASYLVSQMP